MPRKEKIKLTKIIALRSFLAVLSVVIGILITAQMRSTPTRVVNPIAPYSSLKETREALYEEQAFLKEEIVDLQKSIEKTQNESKDVNLTKNEIGSLYNKKAQAGLTRLNGPGVIVRLNDNSEGLASEESIVHAADLRDIVNLLWGSGAEAVSINNQRVVINTAIDCIVNTILVNNMRLTTPFQIEAIGDQDVMYSQLADKNILSDIHQRKEENGLVFEIERNNDITVPVFDGSFEINSKSF